MPYNKSTQKDYGENPLQKRSGFKLKSGNTSAFKMMGSSSPVRMEGHGAEEGHSHLDSGKVDPSTLSNRYSEFNKEQVEKGYPTKEVTIKGGKRGWSWSNKPDEFHPMVSTQGERDALIAEKQDKKKIGGEGVKGEVDPTTDKSDVTRKAIIKEANINTKEKTKEQLLKEAGKSTNIFNQLFSSKDKLVGEQQAKHNREMKDMQVGQTMSRDTKEGLGGDKYTGVVEKEEDGPIERKASGFKMPGYGKRKK